MPYDLKQQQLEFMSRQEGRKLVMLGLVLVMALGYLFTRPHVPMPADPQPAGEVGVVVNPPTQDAARVLQTMARHDQRVRTGEVAPVQTGQAPFEPDPQVLAGVEDFALDVVEEPAFYQLLAAVHSRTDEELERLPVEQGTWSWDQLTTEAGRAQARGKYARLTGRFMTPLFQRILERYPNETGDLAWVWQGTFRAGNRGFFVTITDKDFEPKAGPAGDHIELVGTFLKVYRFTPASDEVRAEHSFPHIVVKRMKRLPQTAPIARDRTPAGVILGVLFAVAFLTMAIYTRAGRKGERQFEAWRFEKLKKKTRAALKASLDQAARDAVTGDAATAATAPPPAGPATDPALGSPETAPPVAEPAPPVAEPAPPVAEPAPPVAEPAPPVTEPAPPVAEPAPAAADTAPAVADPAPAPAAADPAPAPAAADTTPPAADPAPDATAAPAEDPQPPPA